MQNDRLCTEELDDLVNSAGLELTVEPSASPYWKNQRILFGRMKCLNWKAEESMLKA